MKIITNRDEASRAGYIRATGGRYFVVRATGETLFLPLLRYDGYIDIKEHECWPPTEMHPKLKTVNDLIADGVLDEAETYRSFDVNLSAFSSCRSDDNPPFTGKVVREVIAAFSKAGFRVTREALMHNFLAWNADLKSGFRDEANGYHLFTPCGCNLLSFRATSLESDLDDWQTTYEC